MGQILIFVLGGGHLPFVGQTSLQCLDKELLQSFVMSP